MKRFFLIIIISISCGEAVDIEATIDARALRISMDNINNISTATPQPIPTPLPTSTPQPTPQLYLFKKKVLRRLQKRLQKFMLMMLMSFLKKEIILL